MHRELSARLAELPPFFETETELGHPNFYYQKHPKGWRWCMFLDGTPVSDNIFYPSGEAAYDAARRYRINEVFDTAIENQCDFWKLDEPSATKAKTDLEDLRSFVLERIYRRS